MRAAVDAAKVTTSPQPWYWPYERATRALTRACRVSQSGRASARGSFSSSSTCWYWRCQPLTRAGLTLMSPSRTACSMTRTRTAMVFFTVERLYSSAIHR